MKNLNVKFVVSFFLCLGSAFTNKVAKVEVMTSNCEDCGMGPFGSLSIDQDTYLNGNLLKKFEIKKNPNFQIYGVFGDCLSDGLDNPFEDDFNEGTVL